MNKTAAAAAAAALERYTRRTKCGKDSFTIANIVLGDADCASGDYCVNECGINIAACRKRRWIYSPCSRNFCHFYALSRTLDARMCVLYILCAQQNGSASTSNLESDPIDSLRARTSTITFIDEDPRGPPAARVR